MVEAGGTRKVDNKKMIPWVHPLVSWEHPADIGGLAGTPVQVLGAPRLSGRVCPGCGRVVPGRTAGVHPPPPWVPPGKVVGAPSEGCTMGKPMHDCRVRNGQTAKKTAFFLPHATAVQALNTCKWCPENPNFASPRTARAPVEEPECMEHAKGWRTGAQTAPKNAIFFRPALRMEHPTKEPPSSYYIVVQKACKWAPKPPQNPNFSGPRSCRTHPAVLLGMHPAWMGGCTQPAGCPPQAPINLFTIDIPGHTNPPKCLIEVCTRALQSRLEVQIHSKREQPGTLPGPPSSAVVFRM
ncbi:hypothetical protein B0H13DRAFT_1895236 [Mycena leptocephala]|nr:hypothetical protein B0H13DRAFT_1895236 [Mycena leptocephala]